MDKKKMIGGALAVSLLALSPWAAVHAEPVKWTNVNAFEEQTGSLFNQENKRWNPLKNGIRWCFLIHTAM
ncbi:hypothetical protein M493_02175 [Geobacillus genomosp. 3]|uniref:Uncharacterized protein n=1 Tax=Geobacillus genomosp. 3 TaxID=1921421 RepID=S5YVQ5_GEOG3|nr:hypothetical protein M493_02175 [Geobacillus genomosp. 3]